MARAAQRAASPSHREKGNGHQGKGFGAKTITNRTAGKTFRKSATVTNAKRSSAEWIAEAPCCTAGGGILPLSNFGTILFGENNTGVTGTAHAVDGTTSGPIGAFSKIKAIIMEKKSVQEAIPSGLSSDGTSFSVAWANR